MAPGTASVASSSSASASLPLPPGFFEAHRRARLSEELRRQYVEFAEASLRKVFALSDSHKNSWIPLREKKGVAVFRNFGALRGAKAHKSNVAEVAGKGELAGSLAEVGRAYAAHDSARFQRLVKKLHPSGGGMLDAAVLFTVVPCAAATPFRYIGVKWFALKTPTPLVAHRDYCCLEVTDKMVDSLGNEMFVRVLSSIDVGDACPSLEHSHGLVRAKMLAGFMYRADRAEPGVVRVHHVLRFDPGGYFPAQWAFKLAESQLVTGVVQLRRLVDKQQMTACTFVDRAHWVPNDQRRHCAVCARAFGTFRPRHHCRACGEVICGKCSVLKRVDVPGTTLRNVRICSVCNMTVQHGGAAASRPPAAAAAAAAAGAGGLAGLVVGAHDPLGRSRMSSSQVSDATSDNSTSSFTSSSTVAQNEMNLMDLYMGAGAPDTPSASSDTSTSSNLSIRSTTSTQSSYDARGRNRRGHSGGRGAGGFGFFPEASNTPRSYIANNLTPHSGKGFGSGPVTPSSDASSTTPSHRMESLQQHVPLDLGYLRDTVRLGGDGDNQAEDGSSSQGLQPDAEGEGGAGLTMNTPDATSSSSAAAPAASPALDEKTPSLRTSEQQQPGQPDVGAAAEEEEKAASPLESKAVEPQVDARASSASAGKEGGVAESDARRRHRARPSDGSSSSRQLASRALARLSSSRDDVGRASLSGSARKSLFGGLFSSRGRSSSVDLPRSSVA